MSRGDSRLSVCTVSFIGHVILTKVLTEEYPAVLGGKNVIRLSLGKLLVNLLQVVKRTNTPRSP